MSCHDIIYNDTSVTFRICVSCDRVNFMVCCNVALAPTVNAIHVLNSEMSVQSGHAIKYGIFRIPGLAL